MRLLILSASARFIASSCERAGCEFHAIDLFGDWDLRRLCDSSKGNTNKCSSVKSFDEIFFPLDKPFDGLVFGGGFENHPELIRKFDRYVPVLGTGSDQLARLINIENYDVVSDLINSTGGRAPEVRTRIYENDDLTQWVRKKTAGTGGRHIRFADVEDFRQQAESGYVYQQFIVGESVSAVFINSPQHSCQLLGLTKQLVGESDLGACSFSYCGSIGPLDKTNYDLEVIEGIGQAISSEFRIAGVFGIDMIINRIGIWPVDINPRIPSSAEIFELYQASHVDDQMESGLFSIAGIHLAACRSNTSELAVRNAIGKNSSSDIIGKAILCWRPAESIVIDPVCQRILLDEYWNAKNEQLPRRWVADIPCAGKAIHCGDPVLSLFAREATIERVEKQLLCYAGKLEFALASRQGIDHSGEFRNSISTAANHRES